MAKAGQLLLITLLLLGCSGSHKKVEGPAAGPAGQRFPALVRVPARATYAAAVVRLDLMTRLFRDLASLVPTASSPWASSPGFAQEMDQEFRRSLGMSPIDAADLAQHGFAVDASAAVFSNGVFPTFLLPVADRARVQKLLEAATKQTTVIVAEHRGVHHTSWISGPFLVAYALVEGYLIVHLGSTELEKGKTAWLDEVLDAGTGILGEADLTWAFDQAGNRKEALGLVRTPQLGTALRAVEDKLKLRSGQACDALDQKAAGTLGRIALAATLADGKLDGAVFAEVSKGATGAVGAHLAPPPDGRYLAARGEAGFHASTGLDLDWMSQIAREFSKSECGIVWGVLAELELWRLSDPFAALQGKRIFSSYHAAVLGARVSGSSLDLQAVAWLGVADPKTLDYYLGIAVPGPFRSTRKVGAEEVTRLNLSLLSVAEPIDLVNRDATLRIATGRGLIERLLQGAAAPAKGAEVFSFRFQADRFSDLQAPLAWLANRLGESDRSAEEMARFLGRFKWFGLMASLEGAGIRVAGGFELR